MGIRAFAKQNGERPTRHRRLLDARPGAHKGRLLTLDKLAPRFKKSAPDFFSGYEGARVIVDAASARKAPAPAPANGATHRAEPLLADARG